MTAESKVAIEENGLLNFMGKLVAFTLIALPFFLPFFKPAVSIGLGTLVGLGLLHLFFCRESKNRALAIWKAHRTLLLVYLFFLIWLFSSAFWSEAEDRFYRALRFNEMLLVPFVCLVFRTEIRNAFQPMLISLLIGSTIAGLITMWFVIFPDSVPVGEGYWFLFKKIPENQDFMRFGAYSPFLDRLYYSYLTGGLLLALVIRFLIHQKQLWIYVPLVILFPVFFFLGGRGAQLAILAALTAGLFMIWIMQDGFRHAIPPRYLKQISLVYAVAVGCLIALFMFSEKYSLRYDQLKWELQNYKSAELLDDGHRYQTVVLRLVSWEHNLKLIQQNPVVGTGVGDYRSSMSESYLRSGTDLPVHTNQQFLFFGVIGGIPLLVLFLWFFAGSFSAIFKNNKPVVQLVAVVWWLYMLVVMLFDSPLNYQMPAFFFLAVWFSLFFGAGRNSGGVEENSIRRSLPSRDRAGE